MTDSFKTDSLRRALIAGAAAFVLVACSGGEPSGTSEKTTSNGGDYETATDYATGSKDAKVTVVEYASVVCGACANWHTTVYPDFKKKYVDTGKVRYVYRPFPTSPTELADAGHMIAMCADRKSFMKNISLQFKRQKQIFDMAGKGKAREAYLSIAKAAGLSEDDFVSCLQNPEIKAQYEAVVKGGSESGVTGTPSFFINGTKEKVFTLEQIEDVILPILGEPIPDRSENIDPEIPETKAE